MCKDLSKEIYMCNKFALSLMTKVKVFQKYVKLSRSMSQSQELCYMYYVKGITRNTHVKYQNPVFYGF